MILKRHYIIELGYVMHEAEGDLLCKSTNEMVCFVNTKFSH